VWRLRRRRRLACAVERQRRQRRPARAASTAVEETDGVERDGDLESFAMKSKIPRDGLLFIGSKLSEAIVVKNLLIVLESGSMRF
jgi:hypothetical protein